MTTEPLECGFQHFDLVAGLERCCDDREFLGEMIDLLLESLPELWQTLDRAIFSADAVELDESAHALKGALSSMTMGAPYQLARDLEYLGKSGSTTGAELLAGALHVVMKELTDELNRWRTGAVIADC